MFVGVCNDTVSAGKSGLYVELGVSCKMAAALVRTLRVTAVVARISGACFRFREFRELYSFGERSYGNGCSSG